MSIHLARTRIVESGLSRAAAFVIAATASALGLFACMSAQDEPTTLPADAGIPPPQKAKLSVFNGSPNLYPFRLCFRQQGKVLDLPPLPANPSIPMPNSNYPGIAEGAASNLPDLELHSTSSPSEFEIFAARARRIITSTETSGPRCPELICEQGTCLEAGPDYVALGRASIKAGRLNTLTVTGCAASGLGTLLNDYAICGSGYSATVGNLGLRTLDLVPPAADSQRTFVNILTYDSPMQIATWVEGPGTVQLSSTFSQVELPPALSQYETYGVTIRGSGSSAGVFFSLANIQRLSAPDSVPNAFFGAGNYVLHAIGSGEVGSAINADGSLNAAPGALRVVAVRIPSDAQ